GVFTISGTATAAGTFNYTVTTTGTCVQKMATGTIIVNPLPTNNFNTVAPNCETRDIQFTDASVPNAGTITNWQWNFGDPPSGAANTSALQNPVHNFATAGTYNVSLVVTTDKGCVSTGAAIPVTVNLRPSAGFEIPEVCVGDPFAQFTDTSKVAAPDIVNAWAWNFGDPPSGAANASTLQNPVHTYTATGSYNVQLVAISDKGCTDTLVQPLFINGSNPAANFNLLNPNTLCSSDTVTIEEASSVTPGTITKVEIYWDNVNQPAVFDVDDFPATGKAYKHKYPTTPVTAVYTIRYRAYSGGICVDDKFRDITVNGTPVVQFNDMPAVCYDAAPFQITQASETGGVPGTGVFTGPGVSSSGIFDPVAAGIGTFNIKYTFTSSAAGCIDTMTKSITVLDTASAKFSFDPVACEKGAVSFNSTSSGIPASAGSITGWNWDFGDPSSGANNTSTQQNPTHIFNAWGDYTVTLNVTTNNSCKSTDKTIPIHVNPLPRPDFSFNPNHCLPSANVMFTNLSTIPDGTEAAFTYVWDFGDPGSGANSSTGSNPSHIYNAVGPYNVQLQVISGVGCVDDTTIILNTIHPQPTGNFTVDKTDICVGDSFVF
nr:PKD domain-containing protein [Chitinophagaceae bacterium]